MSKFIPDAVLDKTHTEIATATRLDVVSDTTTPTGLTNTLGNVTLTAGDGNGDYVIAAGDVSGRKITVGAQTAVTATATGTGRHVVLSLSGTILAVATCTDFATTNGVDFNVPAFDIEITDPT